MCVHRWRLEEQHGITSGGVCQLCGLEVPREHGWSNAYIKDTDPSWVEQPPGSIKARKPRLDRTDEWPPKRYQR